MMKQIRKSILKISWPITEFIGELHYPFALNRRIKGHHIRKIENTIRPGMCVLSRGRMNPSNLLIGGLKRVYTHTAVAISSTCIVEAIGEGVVLTDLYDFCRNKDYICVLNPTFLSLEQMELIALRVQEHIGKPYDSTFTWTLTNNNAFYCSELYWDGLNFAWNHFHPDQSIPFTPREVLGELTIKPQDFFNAKNKFDMDYSSGGIIRE